MTINYNDLFHHLENLKIVVLGMDYTRPGSDFFQSLTDGHPEIIQTTGTCLYRYHEFWGSAVSKDNVKDLVDEFIYFPYHMSLFDSRFNVTERWNKLGINKNEHFEVDIPSFRNHVLNLMEGKEVNCRNFFLAVHGAYALTLGQDIKKAKIIFYHIHHIKNWERYMPDFNNFKIIIMTRDLRDGLVSYVENRSKSDVYYYDQRSYLPPLKTYSQIFYYLRKYEDIVFIPLKDLHHRPVEILNKFCDDVGIKFLPEILLESSYHGKIWWGDVWSKYLNGLNPEFGKKNKWLDKISLIDNLVIEFLFREQFKEFSYELKMGRPFYYFMFIAFPFLNIVPMKYEIKIFMYNVKKRKRPIFLNAGLSTLCYLSRCFSYLSVYVKKVTQQKVHINRY